MNNRIAELLKQTKDRADAKGLAVRCPVCNAGIGKWCDGDSSVTHPARIAATKETNR